jgi:hypothetical protein
MCKTLSHFSMSSFRNRVIVWLLLVIFSCSFAPSVSFAQQPTATIKTLTGNVLVAGQAAQMGTVLNAGDTLQTQAGASVVLVLSDGSEIQLGEKTQINIVDLAQTATGARVSSIKLLAGWLRAFLSAQHQQKGSSFTIETPNAQVGVKFSQPDVEVSYDPAKQETIGIAHTVELIAINLLTNERIVVPVGSSVIIIGLLMKVITGTTAAAIAAGTGTTAAGTTTAGTAAAATAAGIGTGTLIAIGAGALAAAGGVAAVAASSGGDTNSGGNGDTSAEYIISGGPNPDAAIFVDDILRVFVNANLVAEVRQHGHCCPPVPPIRFVANTGDILRVQAQDEARDCYSLDALWLQKSDGSCLTQLTGDIPGRCGEPPGRIFFDQTFTLP